MQAVPTPQILIRKGGFFSSLASGFFGLLTVAVIGVTSIGLYGMHIGDKRLGALTPDLRTALENWRHVLPLADSLNDRRAPDYRDSVKATATLMPDRNREGGTILVEVANNGAETISLLTLRITVEDERKVPVRDMTIVAATPLGYIEDWIGPILPGSANATPRRIARGITEAPQPGWTVNVEITDIRVTTPLPPESTSPLPSR